MKKFITGIRNRVTWINALSVSDKAIEQVLTVYEELTPKGEEQLREAFLAGRKAGTKYWSYQEWVRIKKIEDKCALKPLSPNKDF